MKKIYLSVFSIMFVCTISAQIAVGLTNDFEDGTTQGWSNGGASPNPPTNIPTGGPSGAGDNFLEETSSGGSGPGSRLVVFNINTEWLGDFTSANVGSIAFSAKNGGAEDIHLRIGIEGGDDNTEIVSTNAILLATSQTTWTSVTIPVNVSDFTIFSGLNTVAEALAAVTEIRILSNVDISFFGENIIGTLHVDDIVVENNLGTDDIVTSSVVLYPNPVKDMVTLTLESQNNGLAVFYDILGNKVLSKDFSSVSTQIDLSSLSQGIYLVTIKTKESTTTKKIIKI